MQLNIPKLLCSVIELLWVFKKGNILLICSIPWIHKVKVKYYSSSKKKKNAAEKKKINELNFRIHKVTSGDFSI